MSPIVLHIPHASKEIPIGVRSTFLPCEEKIERELLLMTDTWTDEIVARVALGVTRVIFPVSRLVVDPERFADDANEPMAARGMALFTLDCGPRSLCEFSAKARRQNLYQVPCPERPSISVALTASWRTRRCRSANRERSGKRADGRQGLAR
jgi:N-formylglutamate amidohydrolase